MSVRVKFVIVGVLLAIALCATAVAAGKTIQAVQGFQQTQTLVRERDARTVRSWMTIPYIARTYNVPESYLYHWLKLKSLPPDNHVTLRMIAVQTNRPVVQVVHSVQQAILTYRGQHPPEHKTATPTPGGGSGASRMADMWVRRWAL